MKEEFEVVLFEKHDFDQQDFSTVITLSPFLIYYDSISDVHDNFRKK